MPYLLLNWFRYSLSHKMRIGVAIVLFSVFLAGGAYLSYEELASLVKTPVENENANEDPYSAFALEVYDNILASYWDNIDEDALTEFYQRVGTNIAGHSVSLPQKNREGLMELLESELALLEAREEKEAFVVNLSAQVLAGLQPAGRSGLFTEQQTQELVDRVNNVDPDSDLYSTLGVSEEADTKQIAAAAATKEEELRERAETDEKAKAELEEVVYATEVLTNENTRDRYDSIGAEPTVFARRFSPDIVHIYIESFSPSTLDEFVQAADKFQGDNPPSALILDVRDNVGGSLDIVPYLLGPLIGPGNYAFNLFSKELQDPIVTPTGWLNSLVPYKRVVLLGNGSTQSSGEVFLSALKEYNVGIFVGEKTRGWGTVERVFPIEHQLSKNEKYGMFLVHSLTIGDDNQPIEGRGVSPVIDIQSDTWKQELGKYWSDQRLIGAVETIWNNPPPGIR